jgi:hypothetical protein
MMAAVGLIASHASMHACITHYMIPHSCCCVCAVERRTSPFAPPACTQVPSNEERKRMLKVFAAERQAAKARILEVGSKVVAPTTGPKVSINAPSDGADVSTNGRT